MFQDFDIYRFFRKAQAEQAGHGFRLPKDWIKHRDEKLHKKQVQALQEITLKFNTCWNSIDPEMFMRCGFEVDPRFTYTKFFDTKVLLLYITKDKVRKREIDNLKKEFYDSSVELIKTLRRIKISFRLYCKENLAIQHYLKNKIRGIFLFWLINERLITIDDYEQNYISLLAQNASKYKIFLRENVLFVNQIRRILEK